MFGSKDARKNFREAKANLDDYYEKNVKRGDSEKDHPEGSRLNGEVLKAEKALKDSRKRR